MFRVFKLLLVSSIILASSCANLHSIKVGEYDQTKGKGTTQPLRYSETGIDVGQAMQIGRAFSHSQAFNNTSRVLEDVWKAITYGPRTGNVVFSDSYADTYSKDLNASCTSKKITGLYSLRESRKYPVISGEIVNIKRDCI